MWYFIHFSVHGFSVAQSRYVQNMLSLHWSSFKHTHTSVHLKNTFWEKVENHNENFNLQKEQPAPVWGWVNSGLLYFMPPHHWGPLSVCSPFRTSTTPLHSSEVPAGSPGCLLPTLWRGFEPGKAKTMHNGPSSTTHDPAMKRGEYGWRGWWEREETGGGEDGGRAGI